MVKHIQTIRWVFPTNCLSVFDHFVGLALKGLKIDTFSADKYFIKVENKTMQSNNNHKNTAPDKFKVNNEDTNEIIEVNWLRLLH